MSEKALSIIGNLEMTATDTMYASIDAYQEQAFDVRPARIKIIKELGQFQNVQTEEAFKEWEGVIIASKKIRAYFLEGETKPVCSSVGCVRGASRDESIVAGGFCAQCPLNAWGSDPKTGGKICKERRRLLIASNKWSGPVMLSIPTTSITPFDEYASGLQLQGKRFYAVSTVFGLERAESHGFSYYTVKFVRGRDLPTEMVVQVQDLLETYMPDVQATVDEGDVIDV